MSGPDRTSTTRLLTLAALLLAAGVFALRASALLSAPQPASIGDRAEQELTYLLEPYTGADKVRVSITGRSEQTVLVMVDGEVGSDLRNLRGRVETVLTATLGFDPETDTLTLTQFPFAHGVNSALSPFGIAELTGLGLLCGLLLIALISRPSPQPVLAGQRPPVMRDPQPVPPARLGLPEPSAGTDFHAATRLAETRPEDTARLVRRWMSYAED